MGRCRRSLSLFRGMSFLQLQRRTEVRRSWLRMVMYGVAEELIVGNIRISAKVTYLCL